MNVMVEGEQELEQELAEDASDRDTGFPGLSARSLPSPVISPSCWLFSILYNIASKIVNQCKDMNQQVWVPGLSGGTRRDGGRSSKGK